MLRIHRDLMRYLINVAVGISGKEINVNGFAVIKGQNIFIPEQLRGFIDTFVVEPYKNTAEFRSR